jgi:hypothetical protein
VLWARLEMVSVLLARATVEAALRMKAIAREILVLVNIVVSPARLIC